MQTQSKNARSHHIALSVESPERSTRFRETCSRIPLILWGLLVALLACQCGTTDRTICGAGQEITTSSAEACVYDASLVIETQFRCPDERPNRQDTNGLIVCCDRSGLSQDELDEMEQRYRDLHPLDEDLDAGIDPESDALMTDVIIEPDMYHPDQAPEILEDTPDVSDDCPSLSSECADAGWNGIASYLCIGPDQYSCALACLAECGCDEMLVLDQENAEACNSTCSAEERSLVILLPESGQHFAMEDDYVIVEVQVLVCGVTLVDHWGQSHVEGEGHLVVTIDGVLADATGIATDHFGIVVPQQMSTPGSHVLQVALRNNDYSTSDIPATQVTFVVDE